MEKGACIIPSVKMQMWLCVFSKVHESTYHSSAVKTIAKLVQGVAEDTMTDAFDLIFLLF